MKSAGAGLAAALAAEAGAFSTCWRIVRRDGAIFRFTDASADLTVSAETYLARVGYARTAITAEAGLAPGDAEAMGLIDDSSITEGDLRAGLFDHAEIRIFLVNRADLTQGELKLRRGRLGEVSLGEDGAWRAEIRGLAQQLSQTIGQLYGPECRADLGDARCGVAIAGAGFTRPGEVSAVTDRRVFTATVDTPDATEGYYSGGVLIWSSGPNSGVVSEVKLWTLASQRVELFTPPPFDFDEGHEFEIRPGCDKRLATCRNRFDNVINFRGEPFIPGLDFILKVASSRTVEPADPPAGGGVGEYQGGQ